MASCMRLKASRIRRPPAPPPRQARRGSTIYLLRKQLRRHLPPTDGHSYMGRAVRGVPDMDGDGVQEYLVGLPYRKQPNFLRGEAWLFSGATGEVLAIMRGSGRKKRTGWKPLFGYYLNAIGDIDGDGIPDLGVSAPGDRQERGAVRVYSGRKLLR